MGVLMRDTSDSREIWRRSHVFMVVGLAEGLRLGFDERMQEGKLTGRCERDTLGRWTRR
jgi:hypothetical protein